MCNKSYQQKMLKNTKEYKNLINTIGFVTKDTTVIEIGCGTGVLTKLIVEAKPKEILGFEIDNSFYDILYKNINIDMNTKFTLYGEFSIPAFININKNNTEFHNYVLISNPPYDILPMIDKFISDFNIKKVILMIPERLLEYYISLGYKQHFFLNGNDFEPSSTGLHYIISKQ